MQLLNYSLLLVDIWKEYTLKPGLLFIIFTDIPPLQTHSYISWENCTVDSHIFYQVRAEILCHKSRYQGYIPKPFCTICLAWDFDLTQWQLDIIFIGLTFAEVKCTNESSLYGFNWIFKMIWTGWQNAHTENTSTFPLLTQVRFDSAQKHRKC